MTTLSKIPGFCTLCRSRCGTLNHLDGDRLIKVEALPGHPTGRATCAKGRAAPELIDDPARILHPLRRTHPKGAEDPGWERIGWEDALALVAERLAYYRDTHGPESVVFSVTTPSGTPMSDSIDWVERFIRLYGSPNTLYGTEICNWHKDVAHRFTFGCGMPTADYANSKLNVLWGHNPSHVWLAQAGEIAAGGDNGARLLVVDPRETPLAKRADLWLPIRPGTDGVLAMAIARELIRHERYDQSFIRNWSNAPLLVDEASGKFLKVSNGNFLAWHLESGQPVELDTRLPPTNDQTRALALEGRYRLVREGTGACHARPAFDHYRRACNEWPLERAAAVTGLSTETIVRAAEMIAEAGAAVSYHAWTGIGQHANATQTERALATLYALTGSFDRPGGNRQWTRPPTNSVNDMELLAETQRRKVLGLDARPLGPASSGWISAEALYEAVETGLPYRPRMLFGFGGNFLVSQPDPARGERALAALEFHVHCDLYPSPTNAYADLLLPVGTPWEREGLRVGFEIDPDAVAHVQLRPAMVSPRGEARPDHAIAMALGCRLGMGEAFFDGDIERGWNHILAPSGLDVERLRQRPEGYRVALTQTPRGYAIQDASGRPRGFETPTRRVELYSQTLADAGYPGVPAYRPSSLPEPRLPLTLVSVKNGFYCHSQQRQVASLRRRSPEPTLTIGSELARARGLNAGDRAELLGVRGSIVLDVVIDETLAPDLVITDYGWWQACDDLGRPGSPLHGPGSRNVNAIIDTRRRDPISGALPLRSAPCDIRRSQTAPGRWQGYRRMRVSERSVETPEVTSFWLEPADGLSLPDYLPGQHIATRLTRDGRHLQRSYSLSGPADASGHRRYRISIRRAPDAMQSVESVSAYWHDRVAVGDEVDIQAPAGQFTLPRRHRLPIVLMAGGIGITPFLSLLETLSRETSPQMPDITLLHASRNRHLHAFRERLAELATALPRLRIVTAYSAPEEGDRGHSMSGRIDGETLARLQLPQEARYYLCASPAMVDDLTAALRTRGVAPQAIFSEIFLSPPAPATRGLQPRRIRLARTGSEFVWHPQEGSLLDSAERHGVALPSGCRVGQCESCAVGVIAGEVDAPSNALEAGQCLSCQAVPLTDLTLDA